MMSISKLNQLLAICGWCWLVLYGAIAVFAALAHGAPGVLQSPPMDDGPVAPGIAARLGDPLPSATPEQLETFARGKAVMLKRFGLSDGLGPSFNIVSCAGCHERPAPGGSSGLYRNFFLGGRINPNGTFGFSESDGDAGGVMRVYRYARDGEFRPAVPETTTIFAQRNAMPFFGVGPLAELSEIEILSRSDPNDADGDGISGRANFVQGIFVGRFGRKAQTDSIESFIRGPMFNHVGVTSNPLTAAQRAALPVPQASQFNLFNLDDMPSAQQVISPRQIALDGPTVDNDAVPDPELSPEELFDLVSFAMLLAAPQLEAPTVRSNAGRLLFHQMNCSACHVPRLNGPRGPLPVYSDLLLHDMGPDLADGIPMEDASGSEFRTQPLWGLSATGPYLHDGRALTIEAAILAHGGEAAASRNAFAAIPAPAQQNVIEFLMSLGGRAQATDGLLPPGTAVPAVGAYGGPFRPLTAAEKARFLLGRALFDRDFGFADGVGSLSGPDGAGRFNGDSCRACHFDPVLGGAGPAGVNVIRHGIVDAASNFTPPRQTPNTILHKETQIGLPLVAVEPGINVFEHRQTPHAFGLGLIDAISEATIRANSDPTDADGNGVSGRVHVLADGRVGRLGWKADVPSLAEFVRDAMAAEIGLTLPVQAGLTFGRTTDDDPIPDPELSLQDTEDILFFLQMLAGPPRQPINNPVQVNRGDFIFRLIGCASCHKPVLPSALGPVPLYSDLLLHDILPEGNTGIPSGDAGQREFRTAPLWGLSQTAPYFHSGEADTINEAILLHDSEAKPMRKAYLALSVADRAALLAFLQSL